MMTNLVSERHPIKMIPGKRSHEYDTFGSLSPRGLKRPRISTIRQFPTDFDPAASKVREACNEEITLFKAPNKRLKSGPSKPFVETLLRVPEKIESINEGNSDPVPKHIDLLCGSVTSPRRCLLSKENLPPKLRKGINIFRDFPRGRRRINPDMFPKCDAKKRMFHAHEKIKNGGAKSRVERIGNDFEEFIKYDLSDGITGPVIRTNIRDMEAGRYKALPCQKQYDAHIVKQSVNWTINDHEALCRTKSKEVINLFEEILRKRFLEKELEEKSTSKKNISYIYTEVAMVLKKQEKWIYMNEKLLGVIPGIQIGDKFRYRAELVVIGLHKQFSAGIDYMELDGKKIATSIVSSPGRYSSDKVFPDVLIYSGQGGNQIMGEEYSKDQALVRGNLALKNSMDAETPVRVIRGQLSCKKTTFIYDGLYLVRKFWQERAQNGKLVYMFRLNRMQGQPKLKLSSLQRFGNSKVPSKARHSRALVNDISLGKEKVSIRVVNDLDDERPPPFNYITKMVYPQLNDLCLETSGCHCIDGCSDHLQCSCSIKNGGMVPFNKNGALLEVKPTTMVHECGPLCKCPPSCKNRVSQHGIKFQLEIFKTEEKGWGVRSRNFISSGSFICEYVGELLNDKQAEERIDLDGYLFDIGDEDCFAIDAAKFGNIGRFFNHSCSPNLYAQNVLYDHDDKMMPHVMLFATQNIRPNQELTYNYNYKIGQVHDSNGNVKKKTCYCGAVECCGMLY